MGATMNQLLFGLYPYVAITIFLVGSLIRFDREQYTWRSGSSQLLRRRMLVVGSNCFHIGVLAILAGHVVGLLTPHGIYTGLGLSVANKQLLAMGAGGVFGVVCFEAFPPGSAPRSRWRAEPVRQWTTGRPWKGLRRHPGPTTRRFLRRL